MQTHDKRMPGFWINVLAAVALSVPAGIGCDSSSAEGDGAVDLGADAIADGGSPDRGGDTGGDGPGSDSGVDGPGPDQGNPLPGWAVAMGGAGWDTGEAIAVDGAGNSYVLGTYKAPATIGSFTLSSTMGGLFVAKLDDTGKVLWATAGGGGNGFDFPDGVAVDASGSTYITGSFSTQAAFGSTTLTSQGGNEVFVARLDSAGKWMWAISVAGSGNDIARGLALNTSGGCVITGDFESQATFGSTTLTSKGKEDLFVAGLDGAGTWLWAASAGGSSTDSGTAVTLDGKGLGHLTGCFEGQAAFGSTTLSSPGVTAMFVARIDSTGKWKSATRPTSAASCGQAIAVDSGGNSIVAGTFSKTAVFGSVTLTSKGLKDLFVARLDSADKVLWATPAGGTSQDQASGIALTGAGDIFITGGYQGQATFGSKTLTSKGSSDLFVARLNNAGKILRATSAGGTSVDEGRGIAVTGKGELSVVGRFMGTAHFGATKLMSNGNDDGVVWFFKPQ